MYYACNAVYLTSAEVVLRSGGISYFLVKSKSHIAFVEESKVARILSSSWRSGDLLVAEELF
jgi:hypothetical protein